MKLLSVIIPCYNSQEYMDKAIGSCLKCKDDLEIIIVDDGSSDNTAEIADRYEKEYPECIRAIHKANGGHGDAVTTGLKKCTGVYFKVLDSDDWFEEESLKKVLSVMKELLIEKTEPDMFLTNYVYENISMNKSTSIKYDNVMPENKLFTWNDVGHFHKSQNILMHSVIYKTDILRECNLVLPKHTFYVDNIFVFKPLPYVKTMYYIDVDLYRYFIGRDDQSVNEKVMIKRIDQQIKVTKIIIDYYKQSNIKCDRLNKYMIKYAGMMMTVSSVLMLKGNTEELIDKKNELWEYLENNCESLYNSICSSSFGMILKRQGLFSKKLAVCGYGLARKIYGFN